MYKFIDIDDELDYFRNKLMSALAVDIPLKYLGYSYIPSNGDADFFIERTKDYQQDIMVKRKPELDKLGADVMAHCMKAADEGKQQKYTHEMSEAWSAQLRRLVKAGDEKKKSDTMIYVQPEYDAWE